RPRQSRRATPAAGPSARSPGPFLLVLVLGVLAFVLGVLPLGGLLLPHFVRRRCSFGVFLGVLGLILLLAGRAGLFRPVVLLLAGQDRLFRRVVVHEADERGEEILWPR